MSLGSLTGARTCLFELNKNANAQVESFKKLASGRRINGAKDDAAGLAISSKIEAHTRSLQQAKRNAHDGISLIQTAEGSMQQISKILIRLRELAIQASSDTIGEEERSYLDKEVQEQKAEITRNSQSTEFNGTKLLNGDGDFLELQIGIKNNPAEDRFSINLSKIDVTLRALGMEDVNVAAKEDAQTALEEIDGALKILVENQSELGALQNRLEAVINNIEVYTQNLQAANSQIVDLDMAREYTNATQYGIRNQFGMAVLTQANANSMLVLRLIA